MKIVSQKEQANGIFLLKEKHRENVSQFRNNLNTCGIQEKLNIQ